MALRSTTGFIVLFLFGLLTMNLVCPFSFAQTKPSRSQAKSNETDQRELDAVAASIGKAHEQIVSAAKAYKDSVEKLLKLQEGDVDTATETVEKRKTLVEQQIVSTREVEVAEQRLADARAKVDESHKQLQFADEMIAEYEHFDPKAEAKRLLEMKKIRQRTPQGRVYYVRFIIVGEITIYDYSGAISGQVIKYQQQVKHDSRKYR